MRPIRIGRKNPRLSARKMPPQEALADRCTATKLHKLLMKHAIELASRAGQRGDAPVGSLVVLNKKIVSEGIEAVKSQKDISAHAELIAIRKACKQLRTFDLSGCTVYATAEPCFMCSYAIRQTRISQVVLGAEIQHKGGITSRHPILTDPMIIGWSEPPKLIQGVLRRECQAIQKKLPPRVRQVGG